MTAVFILTKLVPWGSKKHAIFNCSMPIGLVALALKPSNMHNVTMTNHKNGDTGQKLCSSGGYHQFRRLLLIDKRPHSVDYGLSTFIVSGHSKCKRTFITPCWFYYRVTHAKLDEMYLELSKGRMTELLAAVGTSSGRSMRYQQHRYNRAITVEL